MAHHHARPRVTVPGKEWPLPLPNALMDMHPGAIVTKQRLWHEGRRHAAFARDVLDYVFVDHHIVGHARQWGEAHVDLPLAAGRDFVMVGFDADADVLEGLHHFRARILKDVSWRNREITLLRAQNVP